MKGIERKLGEMKIPLKIVAKPIRQRPYSLKTRYKEKVKDELDMILEIGIIEPIKESEWIIPMVVQDNKA
jgi:hypothetical protein